MHKKLVTIVITTKNEERNIENCLKSISAQTYKSIETIVVDNNSTDHTKKIARRYTQYVFNRGPERSAQRNFGALKSNGEYILFLDADMILTDGVITACIEKMNTQIGGVIIPEISFGDGFWAQVKSLERSFYVGNDLIEAARFFPKKVFEEIGGFDESITGPEDWDFSQRVKEKYPLVRISNFICHNEGKLQFVRSVSKKYYYAKKFASYIKKQSNSKFSHKQMSIFNRYLLFLSSPQKLFRNPVLGVGVIILKTSEFFAAGIGYVLGKVKS